MPTYILLLSLTPEGRHRMLDNPDRLLIAEQSIDIPRTQVHGLYAVLGEYDFVTILDAPDNEAAARFSMELGVSAGVQITTRFRLADWNRRWESISPNWTLQERPTQVTSFRTTTN